MVMAFINTEVPQAASLVANLQKLVAKNQPAGLRGYVIFQGGPKQKDAIEKLAAEKKITIPLAHSLSAKGDSHMAKAKINPAAKNTIIVSSRNRVTANFVNLDPKDFQKVAMAAEKALAP